MTNEQITSKISALTIALNQIIDNARTNDELPQSINASSTSKVRTYKAGASEVITIQQIIDLAIAIIQPTVNKFTVVNGYILAGQNLTVKADWIWYLSGVMYTNPTDVIINIPFASSGYNRIDIIVATSSNTFIRIPGVESIGTPVAPTISLGVLEATFLVVTDDSISNPVEPIFGAYIGTYLTEFDLLNTVRRSKIGDFGFISDTGVFEIAHYDGSDWNFYAVGGGGSWHNADGVPYSVGDPIVVPSGFSGTVINKDQPQSVVTFGVIGTNLSITGGADNGDNLHIFGIY